MKKKIAIALSVIVAALILTFVSTSVYAAFQPKRGIELAADVLGKTVDQLITEQKETGKTIHQIVVDAGKLKELTDARLDQMKQILADKVANKEITQAQADEWYAEMVERMEANLTNGTSGQYGRGFGGMMGAYNGNGSYGGCGRGNGTRRGY
jgi:lipopolysaccharide export LptBFGC system permease protein LptF